MVRISRVLPWLALSALACGKSDEAGVESPPPEQATPAQPDQPETAPRGLAGDLVGALPELPSAAGTEPVDPQLWLVRADASALSVEGKVVASIADGRVAGTEGRKVEALTAALAALRGDASVDATLINVGVTGDTRFELVFDALYSAKSEPAKIKRFRLLGRAEGKVVGIPIDLPDAPAPQAADEPAPPPEQQPVQLVVSLSGKEILVWSLSGRFGTMPRPFANIKVGPAALGELAAALDEVAKALGPVEARSEANRSIVVQAEDALTAGEVWPVLAAARVRFPVLMLSAGMR